MKLQKLQLVEKGTVHEIISDLNFREMSVRWFPKVLTEDDKSKRITASRENRCRYQDEGESFVENIVTTIESDQNRVQ
jgi:hypothetical protein